MYAPLTMGGDSGSPNDPSPGVTGETDGSPGLTGDVPWAEGAAALGDMKGGGGSVGSGGGGEAERESGEAASWRTLDNSEQDAKHGQEIDLYDTEAIVMILSCITQKLKTTCHRKCPAVQIRSEAKEIFIL